jgi:hypothetical protein
MNARAARTLEARDTAGVPLDFLLTIESSRRAAAGDLGGGPFETAPPNSKYRQLSSRFEEQDNQMTNC